MPTASQCQIINTIVARETRSYTPYILDESTPVDPQGAEALPVQGTPQTFLAATPTSLTPLPNHGSSLIPTQERSSSTQGWRERGNYTSYHSRHQSAASPVPGHDSSYQDRVGSASWGQRRNLFGPRARSTPGRDRHREMTDFQQQCMESVERSLTPRYLGQDTAKDREARRQTEVQDRNETTVLGDIRIDFANSLKQRPRVFEASRDVATPQRPVVRFDSTVEVFGSTQPPQNSKPQTPVVKVLSSEVAVETTETIKKPENNANVNTTGGGSGADGGGNGSDVGGSGGNGGEGGGGDLEGAVSEGAGAGDEKGENGDPMKTLLPIGMAGISVRLPIELTEEMRVRLYELGWRKPFKPKKKKKEEPQVGPSVDLSALPSLMDLKKDPMLRKARKARVVSIQTKPPEPNPTAVCFNMLGSSLTHRDVWIAFKKDILSQHPEVRITSIQFVPRAIFVKRPKDGDPIEDRWVISFTSEWFRNRVSGMDLNFKGGAVQLRRYDDVVNCEYRQYTRMTDYMKMVSMKK